MSRKIVMTMTCSFCKVTEFSDTILQEDGTVSDLVVKAARAGWKIYRAPGAGYYCDICPTCSADGVKYDPAYINSLYMQRGN